MDSHASENEPWNSNRARPTRQTGMWWPHPLRKEICPTFLKAIVPSYFMKSESSIRFDLRPISCCMHLWVRLLLPPYHVLDQGNFTHPYSRTSGTQPPPLLLTWKEIKRHELLKLLHSALIIALTLKSLN